jgi:hypothetical protein
VFHVELRQFPHNMCRFNLSERELLDTVVEAWARGEWIEFGERKWNPHQARLTAERRPELSPSEALALAEAALRSLDVEER